MMKLKKKYNSINYFKKITIKNDEKNLINIKISIKKNKRKVNNN